MWKLKALGRKLNWTKIRSRQHYIEILQKRKGAKKEFKWIFSRKTKRVVEEVVVIYVDKTNFQKPC